MTNESKLPWSWNGGEYRQIYKITSDQTQLLVMYLSVCDTLKQDKILNKMKYFSIMLHFNVFL